MRNKSLDQRVPTTGTSSPSTDFCNKPEVASQLIMFARHPGQCLVRALLKGFSTLENPYLLEGSFNNKLITKFLAMISNNLWDNMSVNVQFLCSATINYALERGYYTLHI